MTLSEQIVVPECSRMVLALQELSAEAKLWLKPSYGGYLRVLVDCGYLRSPHCIEVWLIAVPLLV